MIDVERSPHNNETITVRPQRHLDVYTTSSQRYGRSIDVEKTLCAYKDENRNFAKMKWGGSILL